MTRTLIGARGCRGATPFGDVQPRPARPVLPFHATLQVIRGCAKPSGLRAVSRTSSDLAGRRVRRKATTARSRSLRNGARDAHGAGHKLRAGLPALSRSPGQPALARSYVQLTITARHGDTLTGFAAGVFDFAQANAPANRDILDHRRHRTLRWRSRQRHTRKRRESRETLGTTIYQDGFLRLPARPATRFHWGRAAARPQGATPPSVLKTLERLGPRARSHAHSPGPSSTGEGRLLSPGPAFVLSATPCAGLSAPATPGEGDPVGGRRRCDEGRRS